METRRGLALVSVLIFTIIFTILAGVVLGILSNGARVLETHQRDAKAYYVSEAGAVFAIDSLRRNAGLPATVNVEWYYDNAGNPVYTKSALVSSQASTLLTGISKLNITTDYSTSF